MGHLYNFGICQEDELTEAAALDIGKNSAHVLSITSAGEMPLNLLALGAEAVVAVDTSIEQLHLARLKAAAAVALDRKEAIAFLGYRPSPERSRRSWRSHMYESLKTYLPRECQTFWRQNLWAIDKGVIWAGRYERYVGLLVRGLRLFIGHHFKNLFSCPGLDEQSDYFQRAFDRPLYRGIFEVAFHPRLYARRGMDPRSLQHRQRRQSIGSQFFERFRDMCVRTPARHNYFLQLHVLGKVLSDDDVPEYLSRVGVTVLRNNIDRLTFEHSDFSSYLAKAQDQRFNRFHLSNLPDWLDGQSFESLLERLVNSSAPDSRAVWRFIHVDRKPPEVLNKRLFVDEDWGEQLTQKDRFPIYSIRPARIQMS